MDTRNYFFQPLYILHKTETSHWEIERYNKDANIVIMELELKTFNFTWHKNCVERSRTLAIDNFTTKIVP